MGTLTVDNLNISNKINNPSFAVKKGSDNQALSSATWTKVTFDTELFDSNNNFASSRFTPTVAGQYYFCADLHHYNSANAATTIRNTAL